MLVKSTNTFSSTNLKKIEQLIWDFFIQGVKNKKSAFHYPTIGTSNGKDFNLRTVILRKVIKENRTIIFFTDFRSKKIKELSINNKVKIHIYDKKNQIQIQADGLAKIIRNSKNSKMIWDSLSTYSKAIYLTKNRPGTIIKNAKTNLEKLDHNKAYGNFTIVNVEISKIYFLKLNSEINKKAVIKYENKNNKYHWLIP